MSLQLILTNFQECEATLKHKADLLSKLETQKEDMSNTIAQLEKK